MKTRRKHSERATYLAWALLAGAALSCSGDKDKDADQETPPGSETPVPNVPGERFELKSVSWKLPAGGLALASFPNLERQSSWLSQGDEYWVLRDMNGDRRVDLVVTTVVRDTAEGPLAGESYGYPAEPHWLVYLSGEAGFASTPLKWKLPAGGRVAHGFDRARSQPATRLENDRGDYHEQGDESWILRDMDGDLKPDLVVTGVAGELPMLGYVMRPYGEAGKDPHWRVYRNNGAGFETTAAQFLLPTALPFTQEGLAADASALVLSHTQQLWTIRDMNNDGKPDLLVTANVVKLKGDVYEARVEGGAAPQWRVFFNDGTRFAAAATSWSVPRQRGQGDLGLYLSSGAGTEDGDNRWTIGDLTGDGLPDLVITGSQVNLSMKAPGYPSSSHWEVYFGGEAGFGPLQQWALPRGGTANGGFFAAAAAGSTIAGDDTWSTVDINGDLKLDLVVTGEYVTGTDPGTYGFGRLGNDPYWRVHLNNGTGFVQDEQRWALPTGGLRDLGFNSTVGTGTKVGDESWSLTDLDGDRQPELVVFANTVEDPRNVGSGMTLNIAPGFGTTPYWRAYRNVP